MSKCHRKWFVIVAAFVSITTFLCVLYTGRTYRSHGSDNLIRYVQTYKNGELIPNKFADYVINREYTLDLEDEDVIVFLHIQKTGGTTFGRHLVKNLDIDKPCKCVKGIKRCDCLTSKKTLWLFSRYSTGWVCGLHADWTELKSCVEEQMDKKENMHRKRRYHYVTILRDPVSRYLSEWKHVRRGATWKTAQLNCNGRQATLEEVPFCYESETWEDVTLNEFIKCPFNLANNRQTRMLANLSKVNCYNRTGMTEQERNTLMLESAKENLRNLSFFGLTEFQVETQKLFEHVFHIEFIRDFNQLNMTHSMKTKPTPEQWKKIIELNTLDIALYQYAKDLFLQRVKAMNESFSDNSIFPE
ncbi:heparan-sulfate 6-O-sulfotransferase 3-B-like [Saccostrea echinata]|uniref:heparan-sulfate 6-O-sulfotransferase 3-B-like n=1 Tax=Saccostrea echinata TaxID=191078 RepID=UPI002A817C10|nr:heparan-sulfate 6-O-sulfotransferase 3-B-like [Saccostrea echinata]